jgi:hypothetical protein
MGREGVSDQFTPAAKRFWDSMDESSRLVVLNNVWCANCQDVRKIVEFRGEIEKGDLILRGDCASCGSVVARLVEGA